MLHTKAVEQKTLDLLIRLSELDCLQDFILVGGTALALQYGHRKSIDLDFFGDVSELDESFFTEFFRSVGDAHLINKSRVMLGYFIDNIKVDVVKYKYPFLNNPIENGPIRLAHPQDIGAMKLAAITGRGKKKDFVDLYYLLKEYSMSDLCNFYQRKFPDGNLYIVLKSIGYFEDADTDQDLVMIEEVDWVEIKETITKKLKQYMDNN